MAQHGQDQPKQGHEQPEGWKLDRSYWKLSVFQYLLHRISPRSSVRDECTHWGILSGGWMCPCSAPAWRRQGRSNKHFLKAPSSLHFPAPVQTWSENSNWISLLNSSFCHKCSAVPFIYFSVPQSPIDSSWTMTIRCHRQREMNEIWHIYLSMQRTKL